MIRVTILYPRSKGTYFDLNYYIKKHMKFVQKRLEPFGLQKIEVESGIEAENSPFSAIGTLLFRSLDEYKAGFAATGQEFLDDIPNYTDITPLVQISKLSQLS